MLAALRVASGAQDTADRQRSAAAPMVQRQAQRAEQQAAPEQQVALEGAQEAALGVSGFEARREARQRDQKSKSFLLVHKVTEKAAARPAAQLLPALPLPVQHLINSVAVSEELLPDLSG